MAKTEAQRRAQTKYDNKNFDRLAIRIAKGKRDEYKFYAAKSELSLATYMQVAAEEKAERDGLKER